MLSHLGDVAVVIIAAYLIWDFVKFYKSAIGSTWQRVVASAKGAAMSLWTGFAVVVSTGAGGLVYVANLLNAPSVATAITTYGQPKYVAIVMIGAAVIIKWAEDRGKA